MITRAPRRTCPGETRVAATPDTVKKLAASGKHQIVVEEAAGVHASISDADYQAAGGRTGGPADTFGADIVLKVRAPTEQECPKLKRGAMLIGLLNPYDDATTQAIAATGVSGYSMERLPRISRAQSMDVLSSQANIAGYKAVIIAERCKTIDILITTALIPGRPAPKLIRAETVAAMKPGAVIVDLAAEQGGNVEGTEIDQIVVKNGVKIVGIANLPARVPADASALYARNVLNFLSLSI